MTIPSGVVKTKVLDSVVTERSFKMPADIANLLIKNTGLVDVRIRFENDSPKDFFTLTPGESSPILSVLAETTTITHRATFEKGILELLVWG